MHKIICVPVVFFVSVLLFSQAVGVHAATKDATSTAATSTVASSTPAVSTSTLATTTIMKATPVEVEKRVREYFADVPVMIDIARCESNFRQFTDSGNVMRGGSGGLMVGIFQFFESVHAKAALALGFDLGTVEGNISYARHLYNQSGTTPWSSCVPTTITTVVMVNPVKNVSTPELSAANTKLKIELLQQVIVLLQELLKMELAKGR